MANFSDRAPFESEKTAYIHDRTTRPDRPVVTRSELARRWGGTAAGLALSVGFTAVLFSLRDSWDNHREWIVTIIPILSIAGIAMGHLLARKKANALLVGGTFLFLALVFAGGDFFVDREANPNETARDVLSMLGGICLVISVHAFAFALIWTELRSPTKAPLPEM